ncbi:phosphodiester glycosidase family protein [Luteolibacter sp. Populi]|uniref:phosphodiester glycosidase family protein n=1 Tax=Luteolibacter sp. Populi TaxID=3230487 RepID=UPI0034668370
MKAALLLCLALTGLLPAEVKEEAVTHGGASFRVVKLSPAQVRLVWKDAAGQPYRTFDKVQTTFAKQGKSVKFLMNAGIFEPGGIPSGLHIEDGKELHPLNTAAGKGNFFLQPNGVFLIREPAGAQATPRASIHETASFAAAEKPVPPPRYAIQSGPLLLLDGKRHPAFQDGSANKKHRNGVGVDADGKLVFAMTGKGQVVNFWDFAGLFLKLGCKDALFLDGDISQMSLNPADKVESNQFGAMFVVVEQ